MVAKAAEAALISGKIEEAKVGEHEVEMRMRAEEEAMAEMAEKARQRSQTVS